MHRVNLLRHHGVKPIMVFDGGPLPMKLDQENKRARYANIGKFMQSYEVINEQVLHQVTSFI